MVVVHALRNSSRGKRLQEILSAQETDPVVLQEAVDIMEEAGSLDYVRSFAKEKIDLAKRQLCTAIEPSNSRDLLISMADWFVDRMI